MEAGSKLLVHLASEIGMFKGFLMRAEDAQKRDSDEGRRRRRRRRSRNKQEQNLIGI